MMCYFSSMGVVLNSSIFIDIPPPMGEMVLVTSKKTKDKELPLGANPQ